LHELLILIDFLKEAITYEQVEEKLKNLDEERNKQKKLFKEKLKSTK
jgi:hypothetical protein